jgi:hypothetical protein
MGETAARASSPNLSHCRFKGARMRGTVMVIANRARVRVSLELDYGRIPFWSPAVRRSNHSSACLRKPESEK